MKLTLYLGLLFILILACQPAVVDKADLTNIKSTNQTATKTPPIKPNVPEECVSVIRDNRGDTLAYQITPQCAKDYIYDYQYYTDSVNVYLGTNAPTTFPNSAEKLVYGANVDLKELRRVLALSDVNSSGDSLFLMMGIMQPSDSTEIIFALKTATAVGQQPTWRYFDFTRPCPTGCPDM